MTGRDNAHSAFLRSAVLAPAEAVLANSQLLLERIGKDCAAPGDVKDDLARVLQAAGELCEVVKRWITHDPSATSERAREFRHDAKNRLNVVFGICQLMLLDEHDDAFTEDLHAIQHYAERCLEAIEKGTSQQAEEATEPVGNDLQDELRALDEEPDDEGPQAAPASILVVDDRPENRETMARMLRVDGHRVVGAGNGIEALAALRRDDFDLILLDILMPQMNGLQMLREMRRLDLLRHTPVVVVSGWDDRQNIIRCITAGAEDFISRPVDMRLLRARINACLERKRLRERYFEQFFTPQLARHFVRNPELLSGGRSVEVSVLFADVRGFSSISERLGPDLTCAWLQDVLGVLSDCVIGHHGVLVDYIGDEIMAMWGAPEDQPDHALLACRAGREMLARLPEIDARWHERIAASTRIGVGINSGEVYVGNIGTERKLKYSALGNAVNLASRTQGATKYFRCTMLVTGHTQRMLTKEIPTRRLGKVRVNNIDAPVDMFQVAPPAAEDWERVRKSYERALADFEAGRFEAAISGIGRLLQKCPGDMPSHHLIRRAGEARYETEAEFDPVLVLPGK